jgi:transcriptional regulator with XRE-family HTH domain
MRKKEIPDSVITVGANIERLRKEKGKKVRHVAHDADMDIEALRRYIAAKQIMGIDKAVKIAKALEVDVSELFKDA